MRDDKPTRSTSTVVADSQALVRGSADAPHTILGVSAYYHDSAAALSVGGEIVAAAQEERFTREKHTAELPRRAIDYVLRHANLAPHDIDLVVFYESPYAKLDRILTSQLVGRPTGLRAFSRSVRTYLPDKLWVTNHLRDYLGRDTTIVTSDHHLTHAASAFYPSPFAEAAIVTVDGVGEWTTTMIGQGTGTSIAMLDQIEYPNSLGLLYSAFTAYCGFSINSGEYKLMGLAPYGTPRYAAAIREHLIHLDPDGSFSLNPEFFTYTHTLHTYSGAFENLFAKPTRIPDTPVTQADADVAASIQCVLEDAILGLARRARTVTGLPHLVMAGGVALNVTATGALERSGIFDQVWVQPAAGDAGGALGAALWASHQLGDAPRTHLQQGRRDGMRGAFLGPDPGTPEQVDALLDQYGLTGQHLTDADLARRIATEVSDGNIVAVATGRMEFGPRALGNRSILADPRDPGMQKRLNLATKFRESFRPFAPMVPTEHCADYFDSDGRESPYMTTVFPVREHLRLSDTHTDIDSDPYARVNHPRSVLPAITHVDYSARVHTVDREHNPLMHKVLTYFGEITGYPVLVNTSFNVRGEPIVCTAEDAIECFLATDIDVLVLNNTLVSRRTQTPDALTPRRPSARRAD